MVLGFTRSLIEVKVLIMIFLREKRFIYLFSRLICAILFCRQTKIVAPSFFEKHEPALEACCHDIDQWPFPTAGEKLLLPILGCILQVLFNLFNLFKDDVNSVLRIGSSHNKRGPTTDLIVHWI